MPTSNSNSNTPNVALRNIIRIIETRSNKIVNKWYFFTEKLNIIVKLIKEVGLFLNSTSFFITYYSFYFS